MGKKDKTLGGHVRLIPLPSNDPRDPLNWSASRKLLMLIALTFSAFAMTGSPTSNQLAFVVQSFTYGKTPVEISYSASAAIAGFIAGPFIYPPLFLTFGRSAVLFWGIIVQLITQIWAAKMTHESQYVGMIISRLFSGLVAVIPIASGNSYIMEAYFLHQRGRLFALFELVFLFGVTAIPTIGGFVLNNMSLGWSWTFWWTCPVLGLAAVLVFLFVHETDFNRETGQTTQPEHQSFIRNRITTFLLGWRVVPRTNMANVVKRTFSSLAIAVLPVTIGPGFYNMIAFGFSVLVQLLLSIFLQTPLELGGYGFTPLQNAYFFFTSWVALAVAGVTGVLLSDRLPLWFASRRGGQWEPELRLTNMIIPATLLPIGLGIYGAALQYHLHYLVLALGQFLVQYCAQLSVPLCNNYIIECYTEHAVEATIAMNVWRLILGLALPFTATPWIAATGVGWVFGIAAFLALLAALVLVGVTWKGKALRNMSRFGGVGKDEGGIQVLDGGRGHSSDSSTEHAHVEPKMAPA